MSKNIVVCTDGSSRGNPGPGGWAVILMSQSGNRVREYGGYASMTTNNKMELTAAIEALDKIKDKDADVIIHSDSAYVINGITSWIFGWEKNGWRTSDKKPVLNNDLWKKLAILTRSHKGKVNWVKVKGHAGVEFNERADKICTAFADKIKIDLFDGEYDEYIGWLSLRSLL